MNITRKQLHDQYLRAKKYGWIPFFLEAANTITKGFFDAGDLMGIASRETNLDPVWLTKPGDRGNGFGLMQADKRSFPQFTKSEAWKDARKGILFGAEVLMQKWHDNQSGIGVKRRVKGLNYVGKDIGTGLEAQRVTIAAYNNGRWPHYAVSNGKDPDSYTTGHDYSLDVIGRAQAFREMLAQDGYLKSTAKPAKLTATEEPANGVEVPEIPAGDIPAAVTETKTTEVVKTGETTTATEVSQTVPKGDPPAAPAIEVTKNGNRANLMVAGGVVLNVLGGVWAWMQTNADRVSIAIICITVLIALLVFRGLITDVVRMWIFSDPEKKNVT